MKIERVYDKSEAKKTSYTDIKVSKYVVSKSTKADVIVNSSYTESPMDKDSHTSTHTHMWTNYFHQKPLKENSNSQIPGCLHGLNLKPL